MCRSQKLAAPPEEERACTKQQMACLLAQREKSMRKTPESDEVSVCTKRNRGRENWTERLKRRKMRLSNCDLLLSLSIQRPKNTCLSLKSHKKTFRRWWEGPHLWNRPWWKRGTMLHGKKTVLMTTLLHLPCTLPEGFLYHSQTESLRKHCTWRNCGQQPGRWSQQSGHT